MDSPCRTGISLRTRAPHHATHMSLYHILGGNPLFAVVHTPGPRVQPEPVCTLSPYVLPGPVPQPPPTPPPCATAGAADRDNRNLNTKDPMTLAIFVAGSPLMPPRPRIAWPGPIDPHSLGGASRSAGWQLALTIGHTLPVAPHLFAAATRRYHSDRSICVAVFWPTLQYHVDDLQAVVPRAASSDLQDPSCRHCPSRCHPHAST